MSKTDTSIKNIEELLKQRRIDIDSMEDTTKSTREKLKLINKKMKVEEEKLIELIVEITESQQYVSSMDSNELSRDNTELAKSIENVLDNLRKIRNSLADVIRKR
jgi:chromosome segregation ATPase